VEPVAVELSWVNGDKMAQRRQFLETTHFQQSQRLADLVAAGPRIRIHGEHPVMDIFLDSEEGEAPALAVRAVGVVVVVQVAQAMGKMQMMGVITELEMVVLDQTRACSTRQLHQACQFRRAFLAVAVVVLTLVAPRALVLTAVVTAQSVRPIFPAPA
jgi:hypothetical protein